MDVLGAAVHGQIVQAFGGGAVSPPIHQHQPVIGRQSFNVFIKEFGGTLEKIDTNILDINSNNVIALYILIVAVIYIANTVYQKIVSNKLNRELNKK